MTLLVANVDTGDKRSFDHGQLQFVTLDNTVFGRAVFNPGWKWSLDVKPGAGTDSCQAPHAGIVLSGRFHIRMDDGTEAELGPGDGHVVSPGHDAWVVGDEQCVIVDIGAAPVAGPAPEDVVRAYFAAFNAAQVDDIVALFTPDATVLPDRMPAATGHAELRATYAGFFAACSVTEEVTVERVTAGTDVAIVQTRSSGTLTPKGGDPNPLDLRELFGLRRTSDGWRIRDYAFNAGPGA